MKKLFFFKSSSSTSGNSEAPVPTDKKVNWESSLENKIRNQARDKFENIFRNSNCPSSKVQKPKHESHSSATSPRHRRSLSFSSAAFSGNDGLERRNSYYSSNPSISPSSSSNSIPPEPLNYSSRCRSLTPEKQLKAKPYEAAPAENAHQIENSRSSCFYGDQDDSLQNSSICSSNVSTAVLDLYIDGEQQQERSRPKNNSSMRNHTRDGNRTGSGRRPPRAQYTAPTSPIDDVKGRPRSHSFREPTRTQVYSSKDCNEGEFRRESHRKLAKHVIGKLSEPQALSETSLKDLDPDTPITIEEIYDKSLHRSSGVTSTREGHKFFPSDEPCGTFNGCYHEEPFDFQKQNYFSNEDLDSVDNQEDVSKELQWKFKEAKERVFFLSEEIEQESFLQDCGLDVPALVHKIRVLAEERISLALEVSAALQGRIEERASSKEKLRLAKVESGSRIQRLEKEKNELQSALEKELDRRSNDWTLKLEKYQSEEQRLRERVRELAEQNVSLQREVSSFNEKASQARDLTSKLEKVRQENQDLQQNLDGMQEKYLVAEEGRGCIQRNYEEKEKECQELQKSITRLLRTCGAQEKTIGVLREEFNEEIEMKQSCEKFDKRVGKLQMEQLRLTGVEQALRREVESYRSEVDSIRHENINLLHRLKMNGKEGGFSTFKLDQELCNRVCCLQSQGQSLLNESTELCSKLLEFIKFKCVEATKDGLDRQFIVESDAKVQGFERGTENLTRSLQVMSDLLHEKSIMVNLESQSYSSKDVESAGRPSNHHSEEVIRSELKAESLLTSALRDKLLSKQLDVEQLQSELAAAVRGNDILRCEVQNAMDTLSCATHKLKDLELQMLKKDENTNRLQNDLQESLKESTFMRGILPKVSQERDLIWEEVKQYSEKNMLLNSEVNMLKKKIEVLDEDLLVKEGQITILKDSLRNKNFSLLASPEPAHEFLVE